MAAKARQVLHRKALVILLACAVLGVIAAVAGRVGAPMLVARMVAKPAVAPAVGTPSAGRGYGGGGRMARMAAAPAHQAASTELQSEGGAGFEESRAAPWPKSPMVIRNASLELRVEDVPKVQREIGRLARDAGGYVAEAALQSQDKPETAVITIRVPNQGLDDLLERIAALGRLISKQLSAQEVTEEYVDLSSRKRNLEREEVRLLDLLNRAGRVRDLLEVEQQVGRVRGEAEMISGRMRYLENRVALSTVRVQLAGPELPVTRGGPAWAATDVARRAFRSLRQTGRGLATLAIWLGIYVPIWLPVALVLLWWARRTPSQRQPAQAPAVGPIGRDGT